MRITVWSMAAMLISCVFAQSPPEPSHLEGTIVSAITGQPVRKAHVTLLPAKQGEPISATTDVQGKYSISGVPPGSWRLQAARDGFVTQVYGAKKPGDGQKGDTLDLAPGTVKNKLDFTLIPLGSVMGRVVDENGDPVRGVQIAVMAYEHSPAGKTLQTRSMGVTDALGEYRIFDLPAAKYILRAKPQSVQMPGNAQQGETYALVFYPNAPQPSGATPVELASGQDQRGLDFVLRSVATSFIHGHLIKPPGATNCNVNLEDGEMGPDAVGTAIFMNLASSITMISNATFGESITVKDGISGLSHSPSKDGTFDFREIPVGSHTLTGLCEADGQQFNARVPVQLDAQGLANVELRPVGPSTVTAKVRLEGSSKDDIAQTHVSLESPDGGQVNAVQIQTDGADKSGPPPGTFVFSGVVPGIYKVHVEAPGELYTKAVTWNQRDVLEPGLDLTGGGMSVDLDVVLSANGGTVEGSVENGAGAEVTLVPTDPQRAKFAKSMTAEDGHFSFKGIPPGHYKVFAWEDADVNQAMYDPEFRRPFEAQGESVEVAENQKASVQLKAIPKAANQ